ncbi:hypothetical protein BGZ81_006778 [Podila clonocystis]|nr:hypothetical protein BGZ81_006778 [Podila clonocystis]
MNAIRLSNQILRAPLTRTTLTIPVPRRAYSSPASVPEGATTRLVNSVLDCAMVASGMFLGWKINNYKHACAKLAISVLPIEDPFPLLISRYGHL